MRQTEVSRLNHHRERFNHKDAAHDGQNNFLTRDHRDGPQGAAQGQSTHVAHEDLRGIAVKP